MLSQLFQSIKTYIYHCANSQNLLYILSSSVSRISFYYCVFCVVNSKFQLLISLLSQIVFHNSFLSQFLNSCCLITFRFQMKKYGLHFSGVRFLDLAFLHVTQIVGTQKRLDILAWLSDQYFPFRLFHHQQNALNTFYLSFFFLFLR